MLNAVRNLASDLLNRFPFIQCDRSRPYMAHRLETAAPEDQPSGYDLFRIQDAQDILTVKRAFRDSLPQDHAYEAFTRWGETVRARIHTELELIETWEDNRIETVERSELVASRAAEMLAELLESNALCLSPVPHEVSPQRRHHGPNPVTTCGRPLQPGMAIITRPDLRNVSQGGQLCQDCHDIMPASRSAGFLFPGLILRRPMVTFE